MSIQIQGIF